LRAYKVVLDGKVIGTIKDGEQVEFDVAPGRHQLQLKIDWCRSNIVDFENSAVAFLSLTAAATGAGATASWPSTTWCFSAANTCGSE